MGQSTTVFVLLLAFVAVAFVQGAVQYAEDFNLASPPVYGQSRTITISNDNGEQPNGNNTITIQCTGCVPASQTVTFYETDSVGVVHSFVITPSTSGTNIKIHFLNSGIAADFAAISDIDFIAPPATVVSTLNLPVGGSLFVGQLRNNAKLTVSNLPLASVKATLSSANNAIIFTPSEITWTPTSTKDQFFSYRAAKRSSYVDSVDQAQIAITISGDSASGYASVATQNITITPLIVDVAAMTPLVYGQNGLLRVRELNNRNPYTNLTVNIASTGGSFTPSSVTLSPTNNSRVEQYITVNVQTTGTLVIDLTYGGGVDELARWSLTNQVNISIAQLIYNSGLMYDTLSYQRNEWKYGTAQLNYAPRAGVTVTPTSPVFEFDPPAFAFTAAKSFVNYRFRAVSIPTTAQDVVFTVSGADAANVAPVANQTVSAIRFQTSTVLVPNSPVTLIPGQTSTTFTIGLTVAPTTGLTVIVNVSDAAQANKYTVTPSSFTFTSSSALGATFTVTAATGVTAPTPLQIRYYLAGADASNYALANSGFNIGTTTNYVIDVPEFSGNQYISTGQRFGPFSVHVRSIPTSSFSIRLESTLVSEVGAALIFEPAVLQFSPTVWTATFYVTGGQTVPSIYGQDAPVRYTIQSAAEAALYSLNGVTTFEITDRGSSLDLYPFSTGTYNLNVGETSDSFYLFLPQAPISAASTVSVTLAIDGFTVTPNTLTWGVGENLKSFTVTAGSLPVISGSTLRVVQVNDGHNSVGYNDLSTTFSLNFVAGYDAEEGTYGMDNRPLVQLKEVGVPSAPIAIYRYGVYPAVSVNLQAAGLTFSPATVVFASGETVKYFTYTAATPLLSSTRVLFKVSGAGASLYSDWEDTIAAATLDDGNREITIEIITKPLVIPGSVDYGYAKISIPTANDVTVTPVVSQGSGITFSPATFTFSGATTIVPFEIRSTVATDNMQTGNIVAGDFGTTVHFTISGTDSVLYVPIDPYNYIIAVGLLADFDSSFDSAVVDVWKQNTVKVSGFLTSPATLVFWSADPAVEIKPTSIVVQPESRMVDQFDIAYKASAPGMYQIYVNVSGVPQSALYGALAFSNFAILEATKASVNVDVDDFINSVEVGKAYPLYFTLSDEVGSVTVRPTDASGNVVFAPATLTLSPGTPSGVIQATATKTLAGSLIYEIDITGDDVFNLADDSSRYYTITGVTGHSGPTCSMPSAIANFGQTYNAFIVCDIPQVEDSITITPSAPFVTFSPASATILPGTKRVYFNMASSPSVKATLVAAAALGGEFEVPVFVAFSGPDFENVIASSALTSFSASLTLTLRTISTTVISDADFWGNTVSVTYTVSTPVATDLVITPTAQVAGLVFEPASITLTPGASSAAFSLFLDPKVLYAINPLSPVWNFQYTAAITGGDAETTICGANCKGSVSVSTRSVTIPAPPAVSGYNIKSADWTITLPISAPTGLTLKPVSSNSGIEFTPAAGFVFGAGEITKTVTYKVKSDANGEYKYASDSIDLAIGGADRLFFGLDTFESFALSFTSANGQYALSVNLDDTTVQFGEPFTAEIQLSATKANTDVTEVVVTPSVNGGYFTPAFVTLSATQPFATVTGIVANLSQALNIFGAGSSEQKSIAFALSGADAIKFAALPTSTITVSRYAISISGAPSGALTVGQKKGPYYISVPDTARIVDSLIVSLNGPEGFEFTPAASFVLGENNRQVVFWLESTVPYSANAQITLAVEGPAADYFTFENQAWWVGGVDKRTISVPTISGVTTRATFYSFTFSEPIAEELTITPSGDNLVFEPAVIALAAGQTSASFSVRTTGVSNSVITYSLGGADALYYSPLDANPVTVDLSDYALSSEIYQVGRTGTITISADDNVSLRSTLSIVPHAKYTTFTPSVVTLTADLESVFFSFELSGNKADYVWFTYEGPEAQLFARRPLAPFVLKVDRAVVEIYDTMKNDFFDDNTFNVGVPVSGVAALKPTAVPAGTQNVTYTPVSAVLDFEPATWTFDANTYEVAFTATAKYAATATVFFTVDDDENYNVPTSVSIISAKVGFVNAPSAVFSSSVDAGYTEKKVITLSAPIDVTITPVIVGPISVSPAVWNFATTQSIEVTISVTNNMGVSDRNAYVSFAVSGADVASLDTATLEPITISVSAAQVIGLPSSPINLVPGQVVTRVIQFNDFNLIPQTAVTVLMKTIGGVVVNPPSVVLNQDNQWAAFTITLADGAATLATPQILFYAQWAGDDRHYAVGSTTDIGQVDISVTRSTFILPSFASTEEWTVGATFGPFTAGVPFAAIADVTLTPSAKGLTFTPAALTFSASEMFVDFYVTATELQVEAPVTWIVSGNDAHAYEQPAAVPIDVVYNYFNLDSWNDYFDDESLLAGVASPPLNVHLQYPLEDADATVTFTPSAAGLTFEPESFEFSNTAQSAVFVVTAHNGIISRSRVAFTIDVDGDVKIATPVPMSFYIDSDTSALQAITTATTSIEYTIGSRQTYSVTFKLPTPAASELTVHASAPGVVFTDAVFSVGSTTALMSIVSAERAFSAGKIVFTVTGTDATDYSVPAPISIDVSGKEFDFSSAFEALYVGVTSKKYTISATSTGLAYGGAPSTSVIVTPWAAGVVFTPSSFTFSSTTTSIDFTISVAAGAVFDSRTVHYTISGPSASEYAAIASSSVTVKTWTLAISTSAISAPAGIASSAIAISLAASQPALTGEVTVTPSAFGVAFSPASVTISGDKSSATFTATPTYITDEAVPVTFTVTSAGDLAKYVTAPAATVSATMRQINTPADLGLNYVGITSSSFVVSVDYLPVAASNQLVVTPQAAGATFSPASFTFTSTSLPYATFTFSTSVVGASSTTDIAVNFLLTGSDAQYYSASASKYQSDRRPVSIVAGASKITAGESTFVEFSAFHVPATGLTLSLAGGLTYTPASVTLSPTQTTARIEVSGGAPGQTYTTYYTLSGADASLYKLPALASFDLQVQKYTFEHNFAPSLFTNRIGQTSAPFTVRIKGGYAGQSVTLIPSAKHLVFNPAVFTFDANTQALTGTFTVTTPALQVTGVQTTVSWAVAGPAAAWFTTPTANTYTLTAVATPFYSLTVPTGTISVVVGVESPSFRVFAPSVLDGGKSITITPYVSDAPGVEFSPASVTLSGDALNAVFTVTTGFVGSSTIEFQVSGTGANLFGTTRYSVALESTARTVSIAVPPSSITEPSAANKIFVFQKSNEYVVGLSHAPATGVTLTISNPTGGLTVTPSTITFAPGQLTASYYFVGKTYNKATPERLTYTLSGPDAQYYSTGSTTNVNVWLKQVALSFTTGTLSFRSDVGVKNNFAYLDGGVLPTDVTIDLSATGGFEVTPSTVVIPAGSAHSGLFNIYGVENGEAYGYVNIQVSGDQAGAVSLTSTQLAVSTSSATYTFGGDLTTATTVAVGEPQSIYVRLSEPTLTSLTFRCESALFDIEDLVVPVGHTSATVNAVASAVGPAAVYCALQGNSKFVLSGSASWTAIRVQGRYFKQTSGTGSYSAGVGGWSAPVDFGLFSGRGASAPTPKSLNVSFIVSPAGAAIIDPPAIYIEYPASSFTFRVSPQIVGQIVVTPYLTGVDEPLYSSLDAEDAFVNSVIITGNKRSIQVMVGTAGTGAGVGVVDRAAEKLWSPASPPYKTRLIVGQESKPITVFVGAAPSDLAIVLEAPGIVFNPSVLRFTGTYESLSFTMTATEAYGEVATYVKFIMTGKDAALFNGIDAQAVYTHHKFDIPDFPILTINQPQTVSITLSSKFSAPVLLTPQCTNVVFYPEILLFTPDKPTVTVTVTGVTPTTSSTLLGSNYNSIRLNGAQTAANGASAFGTAPTVAGQNLNFLWRYMSDLTTVGHKLPFLNGPKNVNVLPAGFVVSFPHLQIGQTSTLTITATVAPRSDVVLTLVGNNLNFNPPNLLFTSSNPVATTSVTPVHADYQASQNIPFTVDYIISGTNQADFIPPAQSFLAVSRGTAPQADSMVLSAASPAAFASVFLLVASLIALLL